MIKKLKFNWDEASIQQLKEATVKFSSLLNQQETYWKQRAKQFWLVFRDSNTKFFHQFASSRKRKNSFDKLKDEHDQWYNWESGLQNIIKNYFIDIFSSRGCDRAAIFNCVRSKVIEAYNQDLTRPFEASKIEEAIFAMHPDKLPGLDGMNLGFYQHF